MKSRILIIEDEPFYAAILMQQLRELGYDTAGHTTSGEQAIALASPGKFDLAFVDLRLDGELDGIDTARLLRDKSGLESVLMTGTTDQNLIERALAAQPYGFLSKPFHPQALKLSVEMALQRLRAESTLREREEQLVTVLKTSMDGFWTVSFEGLILDVNDAACQMTGYSREELLMMSISQLEYGRTPEQIATGLELVIKQGSVQIERLARCKDGRVRLIDMSVTCSPTPLRRLYCFGRDITERRMAENSLREREHHLRAIIDNIPDAAWLKDNQGRYLAVNSVWCKYYNKKPENVIGRTDYDFFPPEQATAYWQRDEQVRQSREPICTEVEHAGENGQIAWLEVRKAPFFDAQNNCVGMVGITRDVTQRREAELKLQLLKRAVEQSPASIVITNTAGTIEYVNPYFEKHTGYSSSEAIGSNPRMLNSGEHPQEFFKNLWNTIITGQEWRGEIRNRRKDGTLYWEQASISPMRNENGEIVNFVAVKEDITDRKNAELTMAWQSALVENSVDICCVKDLNLRVLTANQAMARAAGFDTPEQLIGKTDAEIFRKPFNSEEARIYMEDDLATQLLQPGQVLVRQEKFHSPDGSEKFLLTRKFPVFNRELKLIATANISTDITDAKRSERELIRARDEAEAANRAKSTFLATMSHELRTPLNVINGMAAILAQSSWPPEQQHAIEMISEGGNTLLTIIEEILDYSGLQAGKTKLELATFSPLSVAGNALRLFSATALSKGIVITCAFDPNTPAEVIGDPRRLQQVLVNLLQNAVKFTERGRVHLKLSVTAETAQDYTINFMVLDTGIGITPESLSRLFQPFTQADGTITRRFGGTGLGLAISKSFIELMGGTISARSRHGRGSAFSFSVKLSATANRSTAFASLAQPVFRGRRVLVAARKGAQQRTLLALLRSWQMAPETVDLSAHHDGVPPFDVAVLPAPPVDGAAPALLDPALPVVWFGRKENSVAQNSRARCIGTALDATALASTLAELFAHPISSAAQSSQPAETAPSTKLVPPSISILAAEDNRTNREVIKLVLNHLGYTADLVINGAEAVEAVQKKRYDLLLLDVQMPVMDGLTAASEICRLFPDPAKRVRIVALTANALPGDRERCISAGMDDYLSKPILPAELHACIQRHFGKTPGGNVPKTVAPATPAQPSRSEPTPAPLIDRSHLQTITAGMTCEQVIETLTHLHGSVCTDFSDTFPLISKICIARNQKQFAETIHGLKGCFMMTGWTRAGKLCAQALAAARQDNFSNWEKFPNELQELYAISNQAMTAHLSLLQTQNKECGIKS
ncbi:MAG: PAS domain S-box protein [Nibricoccus sp.]